MKVILKIILLLLCGVITPIKTRSCSGFASLEYMAMYLTHMILDKHPDINTKKLTIKTKEKTGTTWKTISKENLFLRLYKATFSCVQENLIGQMKIYYEIEMKKNENLFNLKTTMSFPNGPTGDAKFKFEIINKEIKDIKLIIPNNLLEFTENELEIEQLANWYYLSTVVEGKMTGYIRGSQKFPVFFSNIQSNGMILKTGFHVVSLRRVLNPEIQNMGMIKSLMESEDVMFMEWKKPKSAEINKISIELGFRFAPMTNLPEDIIISNLGNIVEDSIIKKGVFMGFEGFQFLTKTFNTETNYKIEDGLYLFDMKNSIPNSYKEETLENKIPVIESEQIPSERYFLAQFNSFNYSSLIKDGSTFEIKKVQPEVKNTVNTEISPSLLTEDLVKLVSSTLVRYLSSSFYNSTPHMKENPLFDFPELFNAEQEMMVENISIINLVEISKPGELDSSKPIIPNGVYKYQVVALFDKSKINMSKMNDSVKVFLDCVNSLTLEFKQVSYSENYLQHFASGNIVQLEFYFDQEKFKKNQRSDNSIFINSTQQQTHHSGPSMNEDHLSPSISSQNDLDGSPESEISSNHEHDNPLNDAVIDEEVVVDSFRDEIDYIFPFENTYEYYLEKADIKSSMVYGYNLKISMFMIKKYLQGILRKIPVSDDDVLDGRYFDYPIKNENGFMNESVKEDVNEYAEDSEYAANLKLTTIDAQIIKGAQINSKQYLQVDQITYMIKMNDGVYYLMFRMERRNKETWNLNKYQFEFFVYFSNKKTNFNPPDLTSPNVPTLFPNLIEIFDDSLHDKAFMWNFVEQVDSFALKRRNEILTLTFIDDSEESELVSKPKGKDGKTVFIYDKKKKEYKYDFVTVAFKESRLEPQLTQDQLEKNHLAKLESNNLLLEENPYPELHRSENIKNHQDFSGDNSFKVTAQFLNSNPSVVSTVREKQQENFERFVMTFELKLGDCPANFVTTFKFTTTVNCKKVFTDNKYMLEFKDKKNVDQTSKVRVEKLLRLYSFWSENENKDETELDQHMKNIHINEQELGYNAYEKNLTYRLILINSIHLEDKLIAKDGTDFTKSGLEIEAVRLSKEIGLIPTSQKPTIDKDLLENIIKGITLVENVRLPKEIEFLKYLKSFRKENLKKSEFMTIRDGLSVESFNTEDNDFVELPASIQEGKYVVKVNLNPAGFNVKQVIEYFENFEKQEFTQKITYMEDYEKYIADVVDYDYFDFANARFNVGQEVVVKLSESDDENASSLLNLRRLILL